VFVGTMIEAWVDAKSAPEVAFQVSALAGYLNAVKPVPPTSYNGKVDAATVVAGIAAQMAPLGAAPEDDGGTTAGVAFRNDGVTAQIESPYLHGTYLDQVQDIADDGNFNWAFVGTVLTIWPVGQSLGGQIVKISPETGMVGYPAYTQTGVHVTTLYNPGLHFGATIELDTDLTPAKGTWEVFTVGHSLESETPGGKWFTFIDCLIANSSASIARI
jgi:hypothetical protein